MKLRLLCLCLALLWPFSGRADTLTLSDADNKAILHLSFPTPGAITDFSAGEYFAVLGTDDEYGATDIGFGSANYFAQFFVLGSFGFEYFTSAQLYSGQEYAPTLLEGSYALSSAEGLSYNLVIANDVAVTPEPNSLLLCGTGCAFVCSFLMRRRIVSKAIVA